MLQRLHKQLQHRFRRSENPGLVVLALGIGIGGGLGAVLFRYLIQWADRLFFEGGATLLSGLGDAYVVLLPALGLVLVSAIVNRWAPEARGHGVPEVVYAVKKQGGRIRPRVAVIKALASALCIGSGGSVGREGPIVQIGCTIGSVVGQFLGLRTERVRLLLACGAAAAVGGTFNAPIAGVLFALEVILGSFAARSVGLVVLSSVTSTAICRAILGNDPAFALTHVFSLRSYAELPIYLVLGLVTGALSVLYVTTLYSLEEAFERWRSHYAIKALIGGLGVGLVGWIGIRFLGGRYLFGVGYDGIEAALMLAKQGHIDWTLGAGMTLTAMLLLVLLKVLATSLTLAAGGSGGVFAPALFIGAMAGGAFGVVANVLFPSFTAPPGAYALVGMAAVFAGSAHAPITAVLILFEMTSDYVIILPLMMAVVISYLLASGLRPDSIYTIKLRRLGGMTPSPPEHSTLDLILVADAMNAACETVGPDEPVASLAAAFYRGNTRAHAVVDTEQKLLGIVTKSDVETAVLSGAVDEAVAADILTENPISCTPDERLRDVAMRITSQDVGQLLVVDRADPLKLLGILRRREILWAYGELAQEHRRLLTKTGMEPPVGEEDSVQLKLEVDSHDSQLCFKKIRDIQVPEQCLIVILRRGGRAKIPRGDTEVEPGDGLVLLTTREHEDTLRKWMAAVQQR